MSCTIDNRIVVDLNKVQYASFYYKNQYGNVTSKLPKKPTYRGSLFDCDILHGDRQMTMLEFAKEHKLLDVWTPILRLQLTANHSLKYSGEKAKSIWKEWNRRIFKK